MSQFLRSRNKTSWGNVAQYQLLERAVHGQGSCSVVQPLSVVHGWLADVARGAGRCTYSSYDRI